MKRESSCWYVAPHGDDEGSGTIEHPFATPSAALVASRLHAGGPRRIVLGGGAYFAVALELGTEDAGLSIEAARGQPGRTRSRCR